MHSTRDRACKCFWHEHYLEVGLCSAKTMKHIRGSQAAFDKLGQ